jgi:ribulose-phosphate 3-epimerase
VSNADIHGGVVRIAPSILDSDLTTLAGSLAALERAGADFVHLDVMDGHFVPNISIGVPVVASIRKATQLPLDVHLMIDRPERYIQAFVDAGADILTIHVEATAHPHRALQMIRESGIRSGLALNPGTAVRSACALLPFSDLILLMSVNPGFGGQTFIPTTLRRIMELKSMLSTQNIDTLIEVDGGVSAANAGEVAAAGATVLVAGSAVFRNERGVEQAVAQLRDASRLQR